MGGRAAGAELMMVSMTTSGRLLRLVGVVVVWASEVWRRVRDAGESSMAGSEAVEAFEGRTGVVAEDGRTGVAATE